MYIHEREETENEEKNTKYFLNNSEKYSKN